MKLPGLTHLQQKLVEDEMNSRVAKLALTYGKEAVEAGVAEWAMRYATRAGLLDDPRVIVRAERKRR